MNGDKEVEVKYRVHDPEKLHAALDRHGVVLSPPFEQDDQAYVQPGWTYGHSKIGIAFARLRTERGRHLFTVKKPVDNEQSCVEHECEVSDRDEMHHAILVMGFTPNVRIVKRRRDGRHGNVAFCLDDVDHAGMFLELERRVGPQESGLHVQAELDQLARSLGTSLERTEATYDSLVRATLVPN